MGTAWEYSIVLSSLRVEKSHLDFLSQRLVQVLNARVIVADPPPLGLLLECFDEERGQIRADELVERLRARLGVLPHQRALVLVEGDGYVEGLNFVFGVALEGWGGVVFTARLRP